MKARVFIDTNVFIYAFEYPECNSAKIIDLINKGIIEAIVSEQVVKEIVRYFEKHHNINLTRLFRRYLFEACIVTTKSQVSDEMSKYKDKIKDKDLEQIAVTKKLGIKYLIAYDRDFKDFEEYITPKEFVKLMKLKETNTEYWFNS